MQRPSKECILCSAIVQKSQLKAAFHRLPALCCFVEITSLNVTTSWSVNRLRILYLIYIIMIRAIDCPLGVTLTPRRAFGQKHDWVNETKKDGAPSRHDASSPPHLASRHEQAIFAFDHGGGE